ncbi:protein phosphatase 2C domain-containing protein [Helicobacter bizzozeronii]|uniref:protein phosphatase 2C domain-containing protein n=1 Tax=Helicobacter bizzozeronii TaxID=56877 RepID=UPI001F42388D|nr:protein phosphatase 2C domain-containing protein [Helicobacter bizzozeronii]
MQGRGHELETPPIPCQDKFYPPEPTTYNMPGAIAVIALAGGTRSVRFSHLGAQKTIEVVTKDLHENFTHYFNMARPEEASSAILERVVPALQELSVETANAFQHNKSDVESMLPATP